MTSFASYRSTLLSLLSRLPENNKQFARLAEKILADEELFGSEKLQLLFAENSSQPLCTTLAIINNVSTIEKFLNWLNQPFTDAQKQKINAGLTRLNSHGESFISIAVKKHSGDLLFKLITSNTLAISNHKMFTDIRIKRALFNAIKNLPEVSERKKWLENSLLKDTFLGSIFWHQRLLTRPSLTHGTLKKIVAALIETIKEQADTQKKIRELLANLTITALPLRTIPLNTFTPLFTTQPNLPLAPFNVPITVPRFTNAHTNLFTARRTSSIFQESSREERNTKKPN